MATIESAPASLNFATPFWILAMVGFALMSVYMS